MKYRMLLLLAIAALALSATAYAHHSFAAVYNVKETVKLEGNLVQFRVSQSALFCLHRGPRSRWKRLSGGLWSGAALLSWQDKACSSGR
jgi:hypothetical protein